MKIYIVLKTF